MSVIAGICRAGYYGSSGNDVRIRINSTIQPVQGRVNACTMHKSLCIHPVCRISGDTDRGGITAERCTGIVYELPLSLNTVSLREVRLLQYHALPSICIYQFLLHKPLPSTSASTMWSIRHPLYGPKPCFQT